VYNQQITGGRMSRESLLHQDLSKMPDKTDICEIDSRGHECLQDIHAPGKEVEAYVSV